MDSAAFLTTSSSLAGSSKGESSGLIGRGLKISEGSGKLVVKPSCPRRKACSLWNSTMSRDVMDLASTGSRGGGSIW